jgi:tetratricopeptide (TPR) repeat protein
MKFLLNSVVWLCFALHALALPADDPVGVIDADLVLRIEAAYNFDAGALEWIESLAEREAPGALEVFLSANAGYWRWQADRIDSGKMDRALRNLDLAVDRCQEAYQSDPDSVENRFYYGASCCNRARFHVELGNWFRAYLDSREGLSILRALVEDHPDHVDALFAIGVAECFLSDAPTMLKPLARLLGFKGSARAGVEKLERCSRDGFWTQVEAAYYLAYFHYKIAVDSPEAVAWFSDLAGRYPRNPVFGYLLGRSYQIDHKPLVALDAYRRIQTVCYEAGAVDMGNWCTYQMGNILLGEHLPDEALKEYQSLLPRLDESTHPQEYFYRLPFKIASAFHEKGDREQALRYLAVIQEDWDRDTYRMARKLERELR